MPLVVKLPKPELSLCSLVMSKRALSCIAATIPLLQCDTDAYYADENYGSALRAAQELRQKDDITQLIMGHSQYAGIHDPQ